jgi:hypothetical protein
MKPLYRNLAIAIVCVTVILALVPFILYNYKTQNPIVWGLLITGNVDHEVVIQYQGIVNGTYGIIEDRTFFWKNSYGTTGTDIYTGASLWQILNQTGIVRPNATKYYFRCFDNYNTNNLTLSDIQAHPEDVIIAFKRGDEFLQPMEKDGDGPLRAIVDYTLTSPNPNTEYWAKYVNTVIII